MKFAEKKYFFRYYINVLFERKDKIVGSHFNGLKNMKYCNKAFEINIYIVKKRE